MTTQTDTKANIGVITLGRKKTTPPPFQQKGGGEEGCSKEPELNLDQNIEVREKELQVAGRLEYFLSVWMDITSDRKILNTEIDKNTALHQNNDKYEATMTLSSESVSDLR